ncbi:MAG: NAD(P)-dependent oxidoreductase [Pyrinomonadaceae bacterium]|nr:NAD(P)-dependent oxidoreductase [Pyrinomonadaceae bacterium]
MKILVTGASGFLGKEIVGSVLEQDLEVICVYNKKKPEKSVTDNQKVKIYQADVSDKDQIKKIDLDEKVDVIIHCAGLAHQFGRTGKESFRRVNVTGTKNICELAVKLGCKRFILISSVSVYGNQNSGIANMVTEDSECHPKDFYAESKLESELICREICRKHGMSLSILRPSTIIGEGDRGNVSRLIKLIDRGYFFWFGQGLNYKSLIYKKDVAQACLEILHKSDRNFEIYNLSAEPFTMKEIVSEISNSLNKKDSHISFPEAIPRLLFNLNRKTLRIGKILKLEETFRKWVSDDLFSANLIKEQYGFEPQVSIREAIRLETEAYLRQK